MIKDTIEGLELLKKENKVIWERQKILNRNKDVLFINFEDTDNWLSQAIEWGKALDQATPILAKAKLRITELEQKLVDNNIPHTIESIPGYKLIGV